MEIVTEVRYKRVKQIGVGQGKNSEVYLSDDPQLGGQIAVKEIPIAELSKQGIKDFFGEAKVMFAAQHPENVVPIRFAGESKVNNTVCIAMPFFSRGSLQDRIKSNSLGILDSVKVGLQMLNGLQIIHNAGYLHFDLKPSNVLFSDRDQAMVSDFGQSRMLNTTTGTADTPPVYCWAITPELYASKATVRSDIFQAASTLYRAVNGDHFAKAQRPDDTDPFFSRVLKDLITTGKLPNRDLFMPHVPRGLRTILRKALSVSPTDRHRTAASLATELERVTVKYDWQAVFAPTGEITWNGTRSGAADLRVRLLINGKRWRSEVHSLGSKTQARDRTSAWKNDLTKTQAFNHLAGYFASLE